MSEQEITLREVRDSDLDHFFEFEREPAGVWMAAFTADDPNDRTAFDEHWAKIRANDKVTIRTILFGGEVAGSIASFFREEDREVTYWIGQSFWGKGVASEALCQFLEIETTRPLTGRVANDNAASRRVLEKLGFVAESEERGYAAARKEEIAETIYRLNV